MAINFPDSPTLNQEFIVGGRTWKWDGTAWVNVDYVITIPEQTFTNTFMLMGA